MLHPPGFYFVKKPKRFVILSSDKSSERNLSSFFDIKKTRRMEHLQSEEPFSSDPYFSTYINAWIFFLNRLPIYRLPLKSSFVVLYSRVLIKRTEYRVQAENARLADICTHHADIHLLTWLNSEISFSLSYFPKKYLKGGTVSCFSFHSDLDNVYHVCSYEQN